MTFDDIFEDERPYTIDDLVLGADASEQLAGDQRIIVHAISACRVPFISARFDALERVITASCDQDRSSLPEIHAKEIWNGSERQKSAFRNLHNKHEMQQFFLAMAAALGAPELQVAAAVAVVPATLTSKEKRITKQLLAGMALGRIDDNVKSLYGKHVGRPTLQIDQETPHTAPAHRQTGTHYMSHARPAPGRGPNDGRFLIHSAYPQYVEVDSRSDRFVQVADVAAYFVGKYLALYSQIHTAATSGAVTSLTHQITDSNVALSIWDLLNIEVVLVRTRNDWDHEPAWVQDICAPWDQRLEWVKQNNVDVFGCSLREALVKENPRLSTVGYWQLVRRSQEAGA